MAGETEIRWTYGLQLDIQRLVPDAGSAISAIMNETYVRDYLVRRALTPIKKSITDEKELVGVENIELDPDQVVALLDWIAGHLLWFFIQSANSLAARGADLQANLPSLPLPPLTPGSAD